MSTLNTPACESTASLNAEPSGVHFTVYVQLSGELDHSESLKECVGQLEEFELMVSGCRRSEL